MSAAPKPPTSPCKGLITEHSLSPSCPGLSRASTYFDQRGEKDVDGRDKPGHDGGKVVQ